MKPKFKLVWSRHILKLVALALSFVLWFYVLNSETQIADVKMYIEYKLPEQKAISNSVTREVFVKLKGPRAFIRNFTEKQTKIFIDLKETARKKNKINYKITSDDIPIPFGMQVLEISPKDILLKFEGRRSKTVPIVANIVGELEKNLKLQKYSLTPNKATIYGPASLLKKITELKTRPINVGVLNVEEEVKVELADVDDRIISGLPENGINFDFVIKPKKANVTLKNIDILFLSKNQNFSTKTTHVALDVLVPGEEEKSIKKSEVRVIAEIPEAVKAGERVQLKAELPEGVHLLQIHPEYIIVAPKKNNKKRRRR